MSIKKEQQIYTEIGSIIENFCLNNGFESWVNNNNLLQWGQPTMQGLPNPCILMNYYNGSKVGWVSTKYKWNKDSKEGKAEISNYRKIIMTLTFFRDPKDLENASKNDLDGDIDIVMPEDVANAIRMYFLSDLGVSELHRLGYSILDTSLIRNPIIEMDDEKYARTPNFDITLTSFESIEVNSDFIPYEQQKENFLQNKTLGKSQIIGV